MYKIIDLNVKKVILEAKNDSELIDKITKIVNKNDHNNFSVIGISDAKEYIEDYTDNLVLVDVAEIERFLKEFGVKVKENEEAHFVELMMDDHKCIEWDNIQYYIPEMTYSSEDEEIYDMLTYNFHV